MHFIIMSIQQVLKINYKYKTSNNSTLPFKYFILNINSPESIMEINQTLNTSYGYYDTI